jgi:hypothetical protein
MESYELERRPVAVQITRSGAMTEQAQLLATPAARRERDAQLVAIYVDPNSRHHEAVAEAELDIDYRGSPLAVGEANAALGPGQRLPTTISVSGPDGKDRFLDQLLGRNGHTALLVGGAGANAAELADLRARLRDAVDPVIVERSLTAVDSGPTSGSIGLVGNGCERLGVETVTLFVIRPDGHVGLRADRDHLRALDTYQSLVSGVPDPL